MILRRFCHEAYHRPTDGGIDNIIKYLDLEPKIDVMIRMSLQSFAVLPGRKNCVRKRVVRSSYMEMNPAGRRSS
ncbi:hypothetical protein Tco_0979849 [Tanacetum coccineum]